MTILKKIMAMMRSSKYSQCLSILMRDGYFLFLVDACLLCTLSAILRKDRDKPANEEEEEDIRDDDDNDNVNHDYDDDVTTSTSVELHRLWRRWGK